MSIYFLKCNTLNSIDKNIFLTADRSLVIIAILISVLSLIFAILYNRKTLRITIEHNTKTIMPDITFNRAFNKDECTTKFTITNSGFGPAIIKSISFNYQNIEYKSILKLLEKNSSIAQNMFLKMKSTESIFDKLEVLAPGGNQNVFDLTFPSGIDFDNVRKVLSESEFSIEFEDLYKNNFTKKCNIYNKGFYK